MADQPKDRVEMAEDVETGIAKEEQGVLMTFRFSNSHWFMIKT